MTSAQRLTKQFIIALVFFALVGSVAYGAFRTFQPPPPKPTPDPTAHLTPIQVSGIQLFNIRDNDYDVVAKVSNPNSDYGSGEVIYNLQFFNAADTPLSVTPGSFYILPGQTKYLIVSPLRFLEPVSRAELVIKRVDWQKLSPLAAAGANLIPRDANYSVVQKQGTFSKVGGAIWNNSDYDLGQVDVGVLLLDAEDRILAVNRTEIRTFLAKTTRGFEVSWFAPFVGTVTRVEVEPHTNLFTNSNFLRQYQQPERFQQYYLNSQRLPQNRT